MDTVRITLRFSTVHGWDDTRAQFAGHPTIKPIVAALFPTSASWKVLLCRNRSKAKAKEFEDARNSKQERLAMGEQLGIMHSAQAQKAAKAKATAKNRVPAHTVAVPLHLPQPQ